MLSTKEKQIADNYRFIFNETIKNLESEVVFMNDGFCPLDREGFPLTLNLNIPPKYKFWQYQVLLYENLLNHAGITKNTKGSLLEVSCGLGGGLNYIRDTYDFDRLYGVDLVDEHINWCRKNYTNINFIYGKHSNIPVENESFDFIISVEALAHYIPLTSFIKESSRLLKNKGLLCIATNYTDKEPLNKIALNTNKLRIIKTVDITKNCNIGAALSKWMVPNKSCQIAIKNDEIRHFTENSIYEIIICQKD